MKYLIKQESFIKDYIKLLEAFNSKRELEEVCSNTLAFLLDDTDYHLTINDRCGRKDDDDFWLYQIKLECGHIRTSYNNNNYNYLKNSGPFWDDIKDYYLPLIEVLKDDIIGYNGEQNIFYHSPTLEFFYKYQTKNKTTSDTKMLYKVVPINQLEDLVLDDIWYINLYINNNL